jgi:flagellar biosynthesis/type III secretory pathway protein FliH
LFNQPHPARAEVPWQPNSGIAKKLSSRGYATTSWASDEPDAFAELSYPAKSSGFSAAHYQPMRQPLTQQAQASLDLLEGEYRNESLGEEKPEALIGTETNEHLPFVMDHFGATRKSKLRVNVAPHVLKRALAQAELAESLVVSPITSDDQGPELIVIHPDEPTTENTAVHAAELASASTMPEPLEASVPDAELPVQALDTAPAVVAGIAPEEVAQREAEQFAKGLAQAREHAAAELAAAVEKAMAEGLEKGRQEGLEEGRAQGKAEGLEEGQAQGLSQGLEEGKALGLAEGLEQGLAQGKELGSQEAREAVAEDMAAQRVLFDKVAQELGALIEDPKKFFEPLKRLAMHIAEQVVLGELQTSGQAIERLVQRCLDELDHPVHGAVVLELHPEDKDLLQAQGSDLIKGMRLEAVPDMQRGSVRVFANDTVVEDLVGHRLEGLAHALLVDASAWHAQSSLAQKIVEVSEEAEDDDVHS